MVKRALWIVIAMVSLTAAKDIKAEELAALPGLWKTTIKTGTTGNAVPSQVSWRCVAEDADPWISYARLPVLPHESCERKDFVRTSTSLTWRLDCTGEFEVINEGSIIFDSAQHYTGTVKLTGTLMGYPIDDTLRLEGEHRAACTSPAD
jgi:hypothetical protein